MPVSCQCAAHPYSCEDPATQEDLLCDQCRPGCILIAGGGYHVHVNLNMDRTVPRAGDVDARMQRVREHHPDQVMAYSPAYWDEPHDERAPRTPASSAHSIGEPG